MLVDAKKCPRKAFLSSKVPSGIIKAGILKKAAKTVLLDSPFNISETALKKKVDDAFAAMPGRMFGFEKESECARMKDLLWRYMEHEQRQRENNILSQDFCNKVKIMGEEHSVSAHRLIDRGSALECVRYIYKAPELTYGGQTAYTKPDVNPDLLALQRTGEAEAAKLKITGKPVFAAFYYMKGRNDRARQLAPLFESKRGDNTINIHFERKDEAAIAELYKGVKADAASPTCDEKTCYDCRYRDLCHTAFTKRKLEEIGTVEETPLDQIRMTKAQRKFVAFDSGQCRVNAVAGSGKTTVVVLRTLRLIEEGCDPSHILMITFTEKAKEEMKSRLRRYAKGAALKDVGIDADKIVVETFNSFGQRLLEAHYAKLGFTDVPGLVDEIAKKDIIAALMETHRTLPMDYNNPFLDLPNAVGAVVQMGKIIDTFKANHVEAAAQAEPLLSKDLKPHTAELLDIYLQYNAELVKKNMIDYEDQLRLNLKLKPYGVFEALPYRHIIVDEFQDSNSNQIGLILEMARVDKALESIVVVGDELQASVMRS